VTYRNYPEVKPEKLFEFQDDGKKKGVMRRNVAQAAAQDTAAKNDSVASINKLFTFKSEVTANKTITYCDWNHVNPDLLAVTYGGFDLAPDAPGNIMFWTLKNPHFPERIIQTPSKAMTCSFSKENPNLLAVGCQNGIVAVYDVRKKGDTPVVENRESLGKHLDAVWEIKWVSKGGASADKGETLVSVSSDGRVVEWSMKKGLEYLDLILLKRQTNPYIREETNEGLNFRLSSGFSFDFFTTEPSVYLCSTEDGTIHRCSKSYTEQFLNNYFGHRGPIYKVRINPFWNELFLTASADWTCKIWNYLEEKPKQTFQSFDLQDEILDIEWSPFSSTVFANACRDGRMEIWDLKHNLLDPIITEKAPPGGVIHSHPPFRC
jgi:WD40 repeat protein